MFFIDYNFAFTILEWHCSEMQKENCHPLPKKLIRKSFTSYKVVVFACSCMGARLRNVTASPNFLLNHIALQSENHTLQKMLLTMVTTGSPNLVQNTHQTPLLYILQWCITLVTIMAKCPGPPIAQKPLFWKNAHILTWNCGVNESLNSDTSGGKAGPFLTLPTQVSHSLHHN